MRAASYLRRLCVLFCLVTTSCAAEHVIGSLGFRVETPIAVAPTASLLSLALFDYNHDGRVDIVVADGTHAQLCFLAGIGDGAFLTPRCQSLTELYGAEFLAAAGENLVAAGTKLALLSGRGDGSFALADQATPDGAAAALLLADANLDDKSDALVADGASPTVSIWPLLDGPRFGVRARYDFAVPQRAIVYQDLDYDGVPELAAVGANGVSVYGGRGVNKITQCPTGASGLVFDDAKALAVIDAEGDGGSDLLVADGGRGGIVLLRQKQSESFDCGDGTPWQKLDRPLALLRADFDGDGGPDVLALSELGEALLIFRGALFQKIDRPAPRYRLPAAAQSAAVGDLDGDGHPDVVAALASGELCVLRNVFVP